MRVLSARGLAAITAPHTDEVFMHLLTLSHPDLPTPIRVCREGTTVSRGSTFTYFPFEPMVPDDRDDKPPVVTIRVSAVDRSIAQAVMALDGDTLQATIELVLAGTPDTLEAGPFNFTLRQAKGDANTLEGTLAYEDLLNEPYPGDSQTPTRVPGIFP